MILSRQTATNELPREVSSGASRARRRTYIHLLGGDAGEPLDLAAELGGVEVRDIVGRFRDGAPTARTRPPEVTERVTLRLRRS